MAKSSRRKAGPVRAWVLIDFHHPVARSVKRFRRVEVAKGWPGGASVMRVDRVRRIVGRRGTREFDAFAEIHAADRAAFDRVLEYIEANFSHIEAYEFDPTGGG